MKASQQNPSTEPDGLAEVNLDEGLDDATLLVLLSEAEEETARSVESEPPSGTPPLSTIEVEGGRKYDVERVVATGGMGVVYRARDIHCDRTVAVKVLLTDEQHREENRKRFVGEARITSRLEHPNIVPIHELGRDLDGNVFYSMKYVQGVTLGDVLNDLRKNRRETIEQYPLGRLLTVFQKACDAVAFAHANGIVHRDLKPGNIMIGSYGEVQVLDWGLARRTQSTAAAAPTETPPAAPLRLEPKYDSRKLDTIRVDTAGSGLKTISGTVLGTPGFMAPEQVQKNGAIDPRTDIYALGAILYGMLTLRSPIRDKAISEIIRRIIAGDITPPVSFNRQYSFPHCPDSQIPVVLSEIAMRAMSTDPANRYPSVKELQQEIEDYQNGLIWHLVIDEDFSSPDVFTRWEPVCGTCEIENGELRVHGGELQLLLLKRELPGDVRIEFECRQEGTYFNDVACLLGGIRCKSDWDTSVSGYAFKYGAYTNTLNVLTRRDRRIWSEQAAPLAAGRRYQVRAERVGSRLRLVVNNREVFNVVDPEPLTGSNRTVVGLLGWIADTRYTRLRVYSLGTPWKSDILDFAERHLQKGNYGTAMDLFLDVKNSFPDARRMERATKGYELARSRSEMLRQLPAWRKKLAAAWPGAVVQLTVTNDGLIAEIPKAGIADLRPLAGLPLNSLVCWGNDITDLEPLRGMPLNSLHCAANPIRSLEPLRGMSLTSLRCERCKITTLEPLRGMPLNFLNCSENRLKDGLEPLRGSRLTWLACSRTGLTSLEPLRGLPLIWFFCDANEIADLEPLRGLPLTELSCKGNRVENLEPLRGGKLNTLHCGDNRIRNLEPLRGLPLSTLHVPCNLVESLEPLKDMTLTSLQCGGNRLRELGPFMKNLPKSFLFECATLPIQELEFIHRTWSRDFRLSDHVRNVEIVLAIRRNDIAKLNELAREHRGHRYLAIPKFLPWTEARDFCASIGGHLATITSAEENEFVAALFPFGGSWAWIGLNVGANGPEWVTGEPFTFSAFVDLQEGEPGPRVFTGRNWCYDLSPDARNTFIIEWDPA